MPKILQIKSYKEIPSVAAKIFRNLKGGEVLALTGHLGSGKTFFIKALGKLLKIKKITSPSFGLLHMHAANLPKKRKIQFYHLDLYRTKSKKEILALDFKEIIGKDNTVVAIEWAEKIKSLLPKKTLWIKFQTLHAKKHLLMILSLTALILMPLPVKFASAFSLTYKEQTFTVDDTNLNAWQGKNQTLAQNPLLYQPPGIFDLLGRDAKKTEPNNNSEVKTLLYQPGEIYAFLKTLSEKINLPVIEPELEIQNERVIKFIPPQEGTSLDIFGSTFKIIDSLSVGQTTAELIAQTTAPKTRLSDLNNLGINELVGRGESNFKGSPNNRRHNIKIGAEKMAGVLIKPGDTFSFNDNLGPVEKEQGFLPELVIKKTGTVPELGGGLCQVSSTTFRAAMNAGLPIIERRNHAYAVQYYSPQGTDATIYPGVVDLKFVNNTPGYLLIWSYFKGKDGLIFDFYGTKDSRLVTLEKPLQYDRKSDGSMKAEWTRIVLKDGETSTSTFKSVYQSPALFHKTESFVSATGTPSSGIQTQTTAQ